MGRITDRGFGFIDIDGMEEVFFHSNDIVDDIDIRQMREGDKVLLDLVPSIKKRDRYDAKNVRPDDPDTKNREEVGASIMRSMGLLTVGEGLHLPFLGCTSWQNAKWPGRMQSCSQSQQGCTPNLEWHPRHSP